MPQFLRNLWTGFTNMISPGTAPPPGGPGGQGGFPEGPEWTSYIKY